MTTNFQQIIATTQEFEGVASRSGYEAADIMRELEDYTKTQ